MHLNLAGFRAADSARFSNSHGMLTSWDVLRYLSKHVKTTCGFVNIAKQAESQMKILFFSMYFHIQSGFEQLSCSIRWRVMANRKGVYSTLGWGLWMQKVSTLFVFYS